MPAKPKPQLPSKVEEHQNTAEQEALIPAAGAGSGMLAAYDPEAFIQKARGFATALQRIVEEQKLYSNIQGKKYVNVEGWTTLAAMMGITPIEVSNEGDIEGCYTSIIEMVNVDGRTIARASAECGGPSEPNWNSRPAYARRSMAATRATSKACRLAFSWVMTLGGYAPTPAEEMDGYAHVAQPQPSNRPAPTPQQAAAQQSQQQAGPNPSCPNCGNALRKSKFPDKDDGDVGYYCWKKKGGCGNQYKSYQVGPGAASPAANMTVGPPPEEDGYLDAVVEGEVVSQDQDSLFDGNK